VNARIATIRERVTTTPGAGWDTGRDAVEAASFEQTVGQPEVIRAARAAATYHRQRTIVIHPGELIVGSQAITGKPLAPEDIPHFASPDWANMPDLTRTYLDEGMMIPCGNHQTIDYETIMSVGFSGLIERIDASLGDHDADVEKREFLTALRILAQGWIDYCHRYADLAEEMARGCDDAGRRAELKMIASNGRRVVEHPPETFWEACQASWFGFMFVADAPGRVDQYLYPYYARDIASGAMTREDAEELLCCLWAKYRGWDGTNEDRTVYHMTLGGVDSAGNDAVNELSYLCLDVTERMAMQTPQVGVRWYAKMPREFLTRAVEVLRAGRGVPDFCNDEQIIPGLMRIGVTQADARNFTLSGCHEVMVTGKSQMGAVEGMCNMPKVLRVVLGLEPAVHAGADPGAIESYDALWDATVDAMRDLIDAIHEYSTELDTRRAGAQGMWLASSLVTEGCIASGMSMGSGGAVYNFCNWDAIGISNLADGLATIRRVVFEERRVSLAEFVDAVAANWDGHELLRQSILASDEHFGNDCDATDAIAAEIIRTLDELIKARTPYRGGEYILGTLAGFENAHIDFGLRTGPTPDGRRGGDPLAASLAPAPGRDRCGVTAMLNSVAKMPHNLLPTSTTTNVNLDGSILETDSGVAKVGALIEGHFRSGGQHCQLTFATREQLLAAQASPEDHAGLMVRVAGYSAPFVSLDADAQNEIIERTTYTL
jgi:pyruvate formate-lyase/glycerol dehydratase family glycyl radical enzyme